MYPGFHELHEPEAELLISKDYKPNRERVFVPNMVATALAEGLSSSYFFELRK